MKEGIKTSYHIFNVVLLGFVFSVACSSDEKNEVLTEGFEPLNCTIPGKLQLDDATKEALDKYQR